MSSGKSRGNKSLLSGLLSGLGIGLILLAALIIFRLFKDPVGHEITYTTRSLSHQTPAPLTPPDTDFALVIDKIGASAKIVKDVDPYNSAIYQRALTQGIAHAKGTKLPGQGGNIFLFAHSSVDLLTAERYNSIFYLLHHLEKGDVIKVWYQGEEHDYEVTSKVFAAPSDTSYLTKVTSSEQLTLMTCWPPGTNLKRLLVIATPLL